MTKKFFLDIKNVRTAIDTNKLVVFAGSGISIDAGIPSWNNLINELKAEIEVPDNEQDFLRIAQMYFNERQQKEFIEKIRVILKHKKIKYNEIHEEIFQLNPEHILTTNFDDLLEQVIKKESLPFSVVSKDKEFPYALNTNLLVKVHGDLNETDIVLKEDDYIDYSLHHPLIEAFLKSVFASKVALFIGYSFSDINLKMVIQTVRNILGKDFQNAYLLSIEEKFHPTQREYLKNKGINVINYYDAVDAAKKNYIIEYLNGNNASKENYYRKGESLTNKGQNLLNFVRFIVSYDRFNEPLTEKNLIDQIYFSLNRFSEFKSLPPEFVANLFPFNTSKKYINNYKEYSLRTKNRKLYDLFFDQIEDLNGEIKFKPASELNLNEHEVSEIEKKLRDIILILNSSLIFYLVKETGPDSIGNYGWSDKYKELQVKTPKICNCLNCMLKRFELERVILKANNLAIDETTNIQSDLELAYTHYKIGNFNQSLRLFEEVANKAWQQDKYFLYYISKHNIKTLRNLFEFYERSLEEEAREKIIKELDDIDFDKLLAKIPFMSESEYKLLKYIRDDDVLNRAEKEVNSAHEKILKIYDKYKDGRGWTSGPDYPKKIQLELDKIVSFYTNNYIVIDEFLNFTSICKTAIEAFLISFATVDNYKEKLKEFDKSFFDIAVMYGEAEEITAVTKKYEISKITFEERSLPKIINSVNNFLKSFFEVNSFFGKSTLENITTKNQVSSSFFGNKCRKTFSNIFLLLSSVELNKEIAQELVYNLLAFIQHESFLYWNNANYLSIFLGKNYNLFTKEDFETLLNSILHKLKIYNHDAGLLRTIAFAFKENKLACISDKDLILNILSLSKESDNEYDNIISLWSVSDDIIKKELEKRIIDTLDQKFDVDLYTAAAFDNIIDYNKYFEKYIQQINITKNGKSTLNVGRPEMQSFVFINAMIFIYSIGINSEDPRLLEFTNLTDYMQFYLSPKTFDYAKFKVEWLYSIDDREIFHKRFRKIPEIKVAIQKELKGKFEKELAEIYTKYYMKILNPSYP